MCKCAHQECVNKSNDLLGSGRSNTRSNIQHYNCNGCHKLLPETDFDINSRNKKPYTRCKPCRKQHNEHYTPKKIPYDLSFASLDKAEYWHFAKNGSVLPKDVSKWDKEKYWFHCDVCNHDFEKNLRDVTSKKSWCQYCSHKKLCDSNIKCKVCDKNSFYSRQESKMWHSTRNGKITPRDIFKTSEKTFWFKCPDCNEDFQNKLSNKIKCTNCKLFKSNKLCKHWHPTKNHGIFPSDVNKGTKKKYWFICPHCKHDIFVSLDKINSRLPCKYCGLKDLCKNDDCQFCYRKSFISYDGKTKGGKMIRECLVNDNVNNDGNKINLRSLHRNNNTHVFKFQCPDCNHIFDKTLNNISQGHWCGYCKGKVKCNDDTCKHCLKRSFAHCDTILPTTNKKVVSYWSSKNTKKPRDFALNSGLSALFDCPDCNHTFESVIGNVSSGHWCGNTCRNKTEKKLHHWITERKDEFNYIHYQTQYKPEWADLRKTHYTRYIYDFYLEFYDVKIIIELDGRQHYKQVSNWSTPLHNQIRDKIKENLATNQDINIIRLNQEDVFNDKGNWEKELLQSIHSIRENSDKITMIYDLTDSKRYIVK